MLINTLELPDNSLIDADICIVGAGAAGITIARAFDNSNIKIALLESGDLSATVRTQALYRGKNIGLDYWPLDAARMRYFGGTCNVWGGVCLPLSEDDFEKRDWVANSGWPFTKSDLMPYYRRAQAVCRLGEFSYKPDYWETGDVTKLQLDDNRVSTEMLQRSATMFGPVYQSEISRSKNIFAYLNANIVDIELNETGNVVTGLIGRCLSGTRFAVKAKSYVMALGGIENARLLLLCNSVHKNGIGNQNDLVGRYFSDHPFFSNLGFIILNDSKISVDLYKKGYSLQGTKINGYLTPNAKIRREKKLLVTRMHFSRSTWKKFYKTQYRNKGFAGKIKRFIADLTGEDEVPKGKDELAGAQVLRFGAWTDVVPDSKSRVTLGQERDELGQQRVVLDWRIGEQEKHSLIKSLKFIGSEIGRAGLGRMRLDVNEDSSWPWKHMSVGLHHMGTTRMHPDHKRGVVDQNCKVHGLRNLYISGSSVFPTYGAANPTFTIIALALRLADHIKESTT